MFATLATHKVCQVPHGEHFSMWHGVCFPLANILPTWREKENNFFQKKT